ncbi:type II secretion system protein [Aliivibrio sp. EL58]|uniref:type II secretion system protein n=1 Tax=Aliivibrio sp. EL58 TaxID=2107582 RepID=UPI000EFBEAC8|nr:type II secretion system protein [Aliivibrio sp. EL58]
MIQTKSKGFTLIELIVAIVLLAILSIVVAPKFLSLKTDSKNQSLQGVGAAMKSALMLLNSQAAIENKEHGNTTIIINGVEVPLYNGYPSVRGSDNFVKINQQVKAWLDIDSVDRNTARKDRNAAPFFTDKSTRNNQIFIFFTSDYDNKSVRFKCHIRYENPESTPPTPFTGPIVIIETDDC